MILMIINKSGIAIRMEVASLRVMGRATQGVKLIRLSEKDEISAVEAIPKIEEEVDWMKKETQLYQLTMRMIRRIIRRRHQRIQKNKFII